MLSYTNFTWSILEYFVPNELSFLDDIGYGSWSLWGECDVACGLGKRVRQRVCLNENNCEKEGQQQGHVQQISAQ